MDDENIQSEIDPDTEFDETKNGFAIASLVLGITGMVLSCTGIGLIAGILAIVFGGITLNRKEGIRGMAIAGLVLGIVSIAIGLIVSIILIISIGLAAVAMESVVSTAAVL